MAALFLYCAIRNKGIDGEVELERTISSLGTPLAREDNFWILETALPVNEVRNSLARAASTA